ncbi:hypothetical protein C3B61_06980 [Cryobacterium zongtaii]|uniref:Uncharacterized protein n=1 Tax=Cryobacterium zongtaii TaxID=1259217 RepID=A0A2S3ZJ71_9MICO|nr:hypothetical protein [Cryobacterium zongtaii]POH67631.1 hypothetical protein C3B61_06980 [Cryobacterium zongtaii]
MSTRVAFLSRTRAADDPELKSARAELKTSRQLDQAADLEAYIARLVREAPPFSGEQRSLLAALFRPYLRDRSPSRVPIRVRPEDGRSE